MESGHLELLHPWHHTVAKLLPDLSGAKVLEIGCGRGDFSIWLGRKHPRALITAVDFSDTAIEIARRKLGSDMANVSFQVDDAERLKFSEATFDYVISCECMEHVPHPEVMAKEIRRVLRPNAKFLLTTENYLNGMLLSWAATWWRNKKFDSGSGIQPLENFFLWWRVKRMLERAGLNVDHMESNHFQWLLLPRVTPQKLCTRDFRSAAWKRLFRPFGRHFTFQGSRRA